MASSIASLPVAYLSWKLEGRVDTTATLIETSIQVAGILIFLVITLSLKKLLNSHFKYNATDKYIDWMIKANVVAGIFTIIALNSTHLKDTLGLAALLIIIAQGVVQALFGYRLLKLPNDLGGMLTPFCYANIITGMCIASIVLILVGIFVSALSDLMLGTIFFNIARMKAEEER